MLQLLIVDDERVAIEAIRHAVPWEQLGISQVYEASHIRKAKEIMQKHPIDILLCDIEMPQGNGLELIEWVNEHHPGIVTIFLTCHANFQYAKKAMKYGCLDYILKPLPYDELTASIRKAIDKVNREKEMLENTIIREAWKRNEQQLIEHFWLEVIEQSIPADPQAIYEAAASRKLALPGHADYLPILIKIRRWNKELNKRDLRILDYALRNAGQEVLLNIREYSAGYLVSVDEETWLAILNCPSPVEADRLLGNGRSFIQACNQYFYCDVCCYIGNPVPIHRLAGAVELLMDHDSNNVTRINEVMIVSEAHHRGTCAIEMPDMTTWGVLLQENAGEQVMLEIKAYLRNLIHDKGVNKPFLRRFQQNLIQMVYYVLKIKGIQAQELFTDQLSVQRFAQANRSIEDLILWVEHVLGKAMDLIQAMEHKVSVVQRVMDYIHANLEEDLSREIIADWVGMNPDYLTRLFKKETGLTIVDYISQVRVERAKELLAKTDMPISMIASSVGYYNFSHFSQMFKKHASMSPGAYRNRHRTLEAATT